MAEHETSTFANEDALPRVPLPDLEHSCDRFLEWCAPLLTPDQLTETEAAVTAFRDPDSPAHRLQAALADYDASGVDSWLDQFWRDRYLGRRDRIALNANFFFLFQPSRDTGESQLERAAGLIAGALAYKQQIDDESLPPVMQRGAALSMSQNRFLFSATRIPGEDIDSVRCPYTDDWPGPSRERHIVVFHRGSMFALDVIGPDGVPYALTDLVDALGALVADAPDADPATSVGSLTTKARAEWAASRSALIEHNPANATALDVLERALFCVCLEHETPADLLAAGDALLHGDSGNRWFDKGVSLIVFPDGSAGFNGEHCQLDGTTVIGLIDSLLESTSAQHAQRNGSRAQGAPAAHRIEFVLDDALRADVRSAGEDFAAYAAATATTIVAIDDFGADAAKSLGVSPDAFAQAVYQLAHRRAKDRLGATYESIATRQYRGGRTEAMRVITPQLVEFVAAMSDGGSDDTRREALLAAAEAHVERAKQCQVGDAPEQHLWELQMLQRRHGAELDAAEPFALYDSPGWTIMRDDYLSTSSVPSANVQYWGFGSTSDTCIGVAYALLPERFHLYLSTPASVREPMLRFAAELPRAVAQLRDLLSKP